MNCMIRNLPTKPQSEKEKKKKWDNQSIVGALNVQERSGIKRLEFRIIIIEERFSK